MNTNNQWGYFPILVVYSNFEYDIGPMHKEFFFGHLKNIDFQGGELPTF